LEGSDKRYFFAAAFNGKLLTGKRDLSELERQKGVLEIKTKKLENSFGSLKVKFTFAAAKTKRVH
jgi:hypothetical protein